MFAKTVSSLCIECVRFCLSVVRYNVSVATGNLWGASTEANVYMTMYGDRGDTGVRQLYSPSKAIFQQGKV